MLLVATACISGGANERSVFVDFSHDEFSSFMISNFPKEVSVTPGDTVTFKQVWTGEPHTVTGGTLVNDLMEKAKNFIPFFESFDALAAGGADIPNPEEPTGSLQDVLDAIEASDDEENREKFFDAYDGLVEEGSELPPRDDPGNVTFEKTVEIIDEESNEIFEAEGIPWALDEDEKGNGFVTQNAGQPCFLDSGGPPKDADDPCKEADQRQPVFDGKATYYNSGIIPYEGPQGNTFKVDFANDIDPGSYFFYCAVHGPSQYTEVKVVDDGEEIPDAEAVNRQARKEIETFAEPMLKAFRDARDGEIELNGEQVEGPFAGLSSEAHGSINEFVPETIETEVGEPVTWKMMGSDHTISFDVPEYFPIIRFAKNGRVSLNPKLQPPAGGSPAVAEGEGEGILEVDGGTYDGSGFFSSGLFGGQPYATYTLRFSEPGTYKYACLLHPPMVGTVKVT
jgi:plastocyanin